jgi:protein-S-isoprenylcysteine O-methyltransferase Ste14
MRDERRIGIHARSMASARGTGNNRAMRTDTNPGGLSFSARGGWWVVGQVPLMLVAALLPLWTDAALPAPLRWAGYALLGGAFLTGFWSARSLGHSLTPYPRPLADGEFVARGPYRYARHPIYGAVLLAAAGWALAWQSLWGLAFLPLFFAFFDLKARREERWLAEKYPEYAEYRQRVRKFFPGIY